ncbi:MAG: hypothetical protein EOO41_02750 [Methanobacteriota archaeon]|nr:MAG: hypothetical protein EOO41_02750 [Euryarchaeota archaeon]
MGLQGVRRDASRHPSTRCARTRTHGTTVQPKRHPTDCFKVGRVRVMMKSPEGVPLLPHIPTKEKLIVEIAKIIPTLDSRQRRIIELGARLEAQRKAAAAASAGVAKTVSKKDTKKKAATSKGRK